VSSSGDDSPFKFGDTPSNPTSIAGISASRRPAPPRTWKVLVVDDDEAMHLVTRLSIGTLVVDDRKIELLNAYSGAEGRLKLQDHRDVALVLVDVMMETEEAGLELAEWIRQKLQNAYVRIVLRTGQAGNAPEAAVMSRYDIHDYHPKSELSAQRLRTAVIGGVRAYRDLRTIAEQRRGLEKVVAATATLFQPRDLEQMLAHVLNQVPALLGRPSEGVYFLLPKRILTPGAGTERLVAVSPSWGGSELDQQSIESVMPEDLRLTLGPEESWKGPLAEQVGLHAVDVGEGLSGFLYVDAVNRLTDWEHQMVTLFCSSVGMALNNQRLSTEREQLLTSFERFVPTQSLRLLGHKDVRNVRVGDQTARDMTVMFVDVQGFTRRSERMPPGDVFLLLNRLFQRIAPAFQRQGGIVDKYLGDGAMVLFPGGPDPATRAAVDALGLLDAFNAEKFLEGGPIAMGITLHHGPVMMGTLGHEERFETTVISDVANAAAKMQEWCRTLRAPVLVSAAVLAGLSPDVARFARELGDLPVRGREQQLRFVEVFGADAPALRARKVELSNDFSAAVVLRSRGEMTAAADAFDRIASACPEDATALWLAADCRRREPGSPASLE